MPTPLGHALGGLAAGALAGRRRGVAGSGAIWWLGSFALLGMLPDVDFLFGWHRGPTHSVMAAAIVGAAVFALVPSRPWLGCASAAAYGSHILLDWLGRDSVAPFGLMALWPFDAGFYQSPFAWFLPVCREYWLLECWGSLAWTVALELLLLGPLAWVAVGRLRAERHRSPRASVRQPASGRR